MLAKVASGAQAARRWTRTATAPWCGGQRARDSARAASDAALHRLLAEFGRLGFVPARPQRSAVRSPQGNRRLVVALWAELAPFLRDSSAEVLRGFVQRQTKSRLHPDGVSAPEFLDGQARPT